jgi:replicative DNA helicase
VTGETPTQLVDGRTFVLDAPTHTPAIWGAGGDVLWAEGEGLIITGPQGVGKTTLMGQLALARAGVTAPELLGYPVKVADRPVLYIAADRPKQIARSLRRVVNDDHADALKTNLCFWAGPLPFDLVKNPAGFAQWLAAIGVGTVFVDSLKDIAWPLSSDEVGAAVNRARGGAIAAGIEVVDLHHHRKATSDNTKPSHLADVYGSTWITSGAGSVISLWGQAGDPIVEFAHLKQPADEVGPFEIVHDHDHGTTTRVDRKDTWQLLHAAGSSGLKAADAAEAIYGSKVTKAQTEKVRRRLERLVAADKATKTESHQIGEAVVFRPTPGNRERDGRDGNRDETRARHARHENPENNRHATVTPVTNRENVTSPLREWGNVTVADSPAADAEHDRLKAKFGEEL